MHSTHRNPLSFTVAKGIAELFYNALYRQWIRIQYLQKEEEKEKTAGEHPLRKKSQENNCKKIWVSDME